MAKHWKIVKSYSEAPDQEIEWDDDEQGEYDYDPTLDCDDEHYESFIPTKMFG